MFFIQDELHDEPQEGEYTTLEQAVAELRRRAAVPWDTPPNVAPCTNWRACGRNYEILEYDVSSDTWTLLRRLPALQISAESVSWFELPER